VRAEAQTRIAMDRMYRWTRHIYDASRKYYLLGRDTLIQNIKPHKGEHILELGCGTARNLRKIAAYYPGIHLYGIDASEEMLKSARTILAKHGLHDIKLAQGFAQTFDPKEAFGFDGAFDRIFFSYALSIIPPWRESIDHALELLKSGGEMHIVDFGGQEDLPPLFRKFLFWWLSKFHVRHKPEILNYLRKIETAQHGTLQVQKLYKGYAYYAIFRKF
jgi:S-adenosylmethionine-diacylgycerolhomoserine-N-methlytransferase